jgi:hypothetical protein
MSITEPLDFEDRQGDCNRKQKEGTDGGRGGSLRAEVFSMTAIDHNPAPRAS